MANISLSGVTTGTTRVIIVPAPAASTSRMIPAKGVSVYNADNVASTVTFQKVEGGDTRRIEEASNVAATDTFFNTGFVTLSNTDESLEIVLASNVASSELEWNIQYRDEAQ